VFEQMGELRENAQWIMSWVMGLCSVWYAGINMMTGRWRKGMGKEADLVLETPAGVPFWPSPMHEPLILLVSLPLCRYEPWSYRGTDFLEGFRRELRPLWKDVPERCRTLPHKLLQQERNVWCGPC
jgi:hypothetical protein